ncbi:MAG: preprotein translocase subunit SecY [Candidatus Bipolaricaulia bacterium]
MFGQLLKAFNIPELRKRFIFTALMIVVFRLGSIIPIPGVDAQAFSNFLQGALGGTFQFLNLFTGGALERFSLFAMGVVPYINASIILQLLTAVVPKLKELSRSGEEGRRVITKYTRYGTVFLAFVQGLGLSYLLLNQGMVESSMSRVGFLLASVLTLATGTMLLMWLGERITENGIGNGISMIIMFGIIAGYPGQISGVYVEISSGSASPFWALVLVVVFVAVIAGVVIIQQGSRKINIQFARRTRGRRVYGGHSSHIPIRVNQGGVIPVIFAAALLTLPATAANWVPGLTGVSRYLQPGAPIYLLLYALLIIFFTYFYSAIVFDPRDVSNNIKESGGFIPGVRPGRSTTDYIERILNRITLVGALFLAAIALMPFVVISITGIQAIFLGGTSLLIVVGVGIDLVRQIESHMVMRHYERFITEGAVLGRRR